MRKITVLFALFLAAAQPAYATIAFVQSKSATGSSAAPAVTLTATPIQNHLLVAAVSAASAASITMTSTGWTPLTFAGTGTGGSSRATRMFWKIAGASESSTVTAASGNAAWCIAVIEYSGVATTSTVNVENSGNNFSGVTQLTPTVASTGSGAAVIVCFSSIRITGTWSNEVVNSSTTSVNEREDFTRATQSAVLYDKLIASLSGSYSGGADSSDGTATGSGAIAIFNGSGPVVKTVNGLAIASVKTWNGLANASIKTINGASNQ